MFGVGISELPWKPTSLKPRSSAIIITIFGFCWLSAQQKLRNAKPNINNKFFAIFTFLLPIINCERFALAISRIFSLLITVAISICLSLVFKFSTISYNNKRIRMQSSTSSSHNPIDTDSLSSFICADVHSWLFKNEILMLIYWKRRVTSTGFEAFVNWKVF